MENNSANNKTGDLVGVFKPDAFKLAVDPGDGERLVILYEYSKGAIDSATDSLHLIEDYLKNNRVNQNISVVQFPTEDVLVEDQRHNFNEMNKLKKGDVVAFNRVDYHHTAVFIGVERFEIYHRSGDPKSKFDNDGRVRKDDLIDVFFGSRIYQYNIYDNSCTPRTPDDTVTYAKDKLDETGYSVLNKNCLHFAFECRNRVEKSPPVIIETPLKNKSIL